MPLDVGIVDTAQFRRRRTPCEARRQSSSGNCASLGLLDGSRTRRDFDLLIRAAARLLDRLDIELWIRAKDRARKLQTLRSAGHTSAIQTVGSMPPPRIMFAAQTRHLRNDAEIQGTSIRNTDEAELGRPGTAPAGCQSLGRPAGCI